MDLVGLGDGEATAAESSDFFFSLDMADSQSSARRGRTDTADVDGVLVEVGGRQQRDGLAGGEAGAGHRREGGVLGRRGPAAPLLGQLQPRGDELELALDLRPLEDLHLGFGRPGGRDLRQNEMTQVNKSLIYSGWPVRMVKPR